MQSGYFETPSLSAETMDEDHQLVEISPTEITADDLWRLRVELEASGAPRVACLVQKEYRNRLGDDSYHVAFTLGTVEGIIGLLAVTTTVRREHGETGLAEEVADIAATIEDALDMKQRVQVMGAVRDTVTDIEPEYDGRPSDGEWKLFPFDVIAGEQSVSVSID